MVNFPDTVFVTGIGTDVGKSYATGWLARLAQAAGRSVITQKFVQTGTHDMSEDIIVHRRVMGIQLTTEDLLHVTAPEIYSYPASPDLAAEIDGRPLDLQKIEKATEALHSKYSTVIIEGAGGIMVPLTDSLLTIDYLASRSLPTVVVTNGALGSVSNTLLTLNAVKDYGIDLFAVMYNPFFDRDKRIAAHSHDYLRRAVSQSFPDSLWLDMPENVL